MITQDLIDKFENEYGGQELCSYMLREFAIELLELVKSKQVSFDAWQDFSKDTHEAVPVEIIDKALEELRK